MVEHWGDDADFLKFKVMYPHREGGENWKQVYKAWKRAIKVSDIPAIIDGARRYHGYCEAKEMIGTPYVQMATTFLHQENWLKPWDWAERMFVKRPEKVIEEKPLPPSADELLRRRQNDPRGSN